jgi:hypothetical protein
MAIRVIIMLVTRLIMILVIKFVIKLVIIMLVIKSGTELVNMLVSSLGLRIRKDLVIVEVLMVVLILVKQVITIYLVSKTITRNQIVRPPRPSSKVPVTQGRDLVSVKMKVRCQVSVN